MEKILFTFAGLIVLFLVVGLVEICTSDLSNGRYGVIQMHTYTPESNATTVGYAGGKTVVATSHQSEDFILFLKSEGKTFKVETSADKFLSSKDGDEVFFYQRIGGVFGTTIGYETGSEN